MTRSIAILTASLTLACLAGPTALATQLSQEQLDKDKEELLQGYYQKPGVDVPMPLPTLTVQDVEGNTVQLNEVFAESDYTVLKILRGDWSIRCTMALTELGKAQEQLAELGAQLVVLSPEKPVHAMRQIEKAIGEEDFELRLFIDSTTQVIRTLHIAERLRDKVITQFEKALNQKAEYQIEGHPNASDEWVTPVTATAIIDNAGTVVWMQSSWDTRQQATAEEVIKALKGLQE
jgi:peroxiredoxin